MKAIVPFINNLKEQVDLGGGKDLDPRANMGNQHENRVSQPEGLLGLQGILSMETTPKKTASFWAEECPFGAEECHKGVLAPKGLGKKFKKNGTLMFSPG